MLNTWIRLFSFGVFGMLTACQAPVVPIPAPQTGSNQTGVSFAQPLQTLSQSFASNTAQDLKVLSFNIWGLPGWFGTDRKTRFNKIGPALQDYDLVALQEAFSSDAKLIAKGAQFPFSKWHREPTLQPQGSGLFILSKYPIVKTGFRPFGSCTGSDCLSRKGILFTRIQHPQWGSLDFYTTHYQSSHAPAAPGVRIKANQTLVDFVRENSGQLPVILTGDYNFLPDSPEYKDLHKRLPLTDVFASLHPQDPGFTYDSTRNPYAEGPPERLDYIFLPQQGKGKRWQVHEAQISQSEPVEGVTLSDHFGVSARLSLQSR